MRRNDKTKGAGFTKQMNVQEFSGISFSLTFAETIGEDYWSDEGGLKDGNDSDNEDINGSVITLSRGGAT